VIMARQDETRPGPTGRGLNGVSSGDEYSVLSADADRDQLDRQRLKAAKHAEIAARYERSQKPRTWPGIFANKRLSELRALRGLRAAKGFSTIEVSEVIDDGGAVDTDGQTLGNVLNFTFAEYKELGHIAYREGRNRHPCTIRPVDANKSEIANYLKGLQRPRKAAAKRRKRAEEATRRERASDLDCRASAIWNVLTDKPRPVSQIMRDLKGGDAFRKPDGRPLTGNSLRKAILAKLKSRELADRVDITEVTEKHGKPMFLVCRRQA
jgi:hypothetical protein